METYVADRLMTVMNILVWRTNSRSSATCVEYKINKEIKKIISLLLLLLLLLSLEIIRFYAAIS